MIATSLISLFSAALLIWILIYIYKQKWVNQFICAKNKNFAPGRQEEARHPDLLRRDLQGGLALRAPEGAV